MGCGRDRSSPSGGTPENTTSRALVFRSEDQRAELGAPLLSACQLQGVVDSEHDQDRIDRKLDLREQLAPHVRDVRAGLPDHLHIDGEPTRAGERAREAERERFVLARRADAHGRRFTEHDERQLRLAARDLAAARATGLRKQRNARSGAPSLKEQQRQHGAVQPERETPPRRLLHREVASQTKLSRRW